MINFIKFVIFILPFSFLGQEIVINSYDGHKIHGTISEVQNIKSDLAIIIAGSGPTDRDGNNTSFKNNSLSMLADQLHENGISSFRFDKRGVGKSIGEISSENQIKFEDYIKDLIEIISFFNKEGKYNTINVIGHSEGALIGIIACQRIKVTKYVSIAGPAQTILETIKRQLSAQPDFVKLMSDPIIEKLKNGELVDSVPPLLMTLFRPSVQRYLIDQSSYRPIDEIIKLKLPVLIVQGDNDIQIEVYDAESLNNAAFDSKLNIIEGMNHIMKQSSKDRILNMQTYSNPDLPLHDDLIASIVDFIKS